jgi:hypothetical protein
MLTAMDSGVVRCQRVSGLEHFLADDAGVGQVQMHFSVNLSPLLRAESLSAPQALVLPFYASSYHPLDSSTNI